MLRSRRLDRSSLFGLCSKNLTRKVYIILYDIVELIIIESVDSILSRDDPDMPYM